MNARNRLFAIILALALPALACPIASFAAPKPESSAASDRNGAPQAFSIVGRIQSVDYTANVIVVQAKHGSSSSISLTPTTSVELSGQQGSIADLRPGMRVRVRGSVAGGVMTAESIIVR